MGNKSRQNQEDPGLPLSEEPQESPGRESTWPIPFGQNHYQVEKRSDKNREDTGSGKWCRTKEASQSPWKPLTMDTNTGC
jgi:hypothetical protein